MVQRIREAAAKRLGNPPPDPSSSTESSGRRSSTPKEKTAGWGPKPRTAGGAKAGTQRQQQVRLIQAGCGPISNTKLLNHPHGMWSNLKRIMFVFILIKHIILVCASCGIHECAHLWPHLVCRSGSIKFRLW